MARLVTLDVTNTCIRVAKSVGYHYVIRMKLVACNVIAFIATSF